MEHSKMKLMAKCVRLNLVLCTASTAAADANDDDDDDYDILLVMGNGTELIQSLRALCHGKTVVTAAFLKACLRKGYCVHPAEFAWAPEALGRAGAGWLLADLDVSLVQLQSNAHDLCLLHVEGVADVLRLLGVSSAGQNCQHSRRKSLAIDVSRPLSSECCCQQCVRDDVTHSIAANAAMHSNFDYVVNVRWFLNMAMTQALPPLPPLPEHTVCATRIRESGVGIFPLI
jgi:hypothetical protein